MARELKTTPKHANKVKKRILIAEDETALSQALKRKLETVSYSVETVTNGREAIEAIAKKHYDLALLDLIMPEVDGFAVLSHCRENHLLTPIIILSNLSQEEDQHKAEELGAQGYIVKSDTPLEVVVERIDRIFKTLA